MENKLVNVSFFYLWETHRASGMTVICLVVLHLVLKDLEDGLVLVPVCVCVQEWWTHLWLNEGFASWIEYLCVDHCFPEYDIWTQFVSADYTRALDLDALDSSHPIEVSFEIQDVRRESLKKNFLSLWRKKVILLIPYQ